MHNITKRILQVSPAMQAQQSLHATVIAEIFRATFSSAQDAMY